MIDANVATLVLVVVIAHTLALAGWFRRPNSGTPTSIKIKGRRYI